MKYPSWAKNAYKATDVHWSKTQAQIYKLLGELGVFEIRFTNLRDKFALEFLISLGSDEKPRAVRIVVPIKHSTEDESRREKELNSVHRILFHHLKAKFVAVAAGLTEFEQEFMAHLVINDKNGNSSTMGELLLPQYKKGLESGQNPEFKLLT